MKNEDLKGHLENIAKLFFDGVEGYEGAAKKVEGVEFKNLFEKLSAERKRMLSEVNTEIVSLGGTAINVGDTNGTLFGQMHLFWLNLKSNLSFDKNEALLGEIETGEKYVLDKLEDLLENKAEMAPTTVKVLENAHDTISEHIKTMDHLNK
jgi:uncharacterized protein (TIGR02284 family)